MIKGEPKPVYSPGQLYTLDEMFDEFAKWRMNATIYKDLTGEYHCDIFRPGQEVMGPYGPMSGTQYWGWEKGTSRFEAVQNAIKRLHRIVNEYREEGYEDADI